MPIRVAVQSKAIVVIAVGGVEVRLLCLLCVVWVAAVVTGCSLFHRDPHVVSVLLRVI